LDDPDNNFIANAPTFRSGLYRPIPLKAKAIAAVL
jgi:hypothetical protein